MNRAQLGAALRALRVASGKDDAWALGDSKQPEAQPARFTTEELGAAGIDPARFGLNV
ncbi:hypothetical protein [Streptomyces echinatus]|uniref:Uncharacterized protein n=1 Tax=Streptomyces echinatus TaxID=67293 RepID=A0A7W9PUM7_9ACTN|nr:hypothetical protein [Streptomyces echinatus]MBB5928101.1 hypothetical protein [Streptomyces echinatus]